MGTRITVVLVRNPAVEAVVLFTPYMSAMKIPHNRVPTIALYFSVLASTRIIFLENISTITIKAMPNRKETIVIGGIASTVSLIKIYDAHQANETVANIQFAYCGIIIVSLKIPSNTL